MTQRVLRNVINGETVEASSSEVTELVNPTTGEVFALAPVSSAADIDRAYQAASEAFVGWRDVTPSARQAALLKIADVLEAHAEELNALESENTGKPIAVTATEEIPPMLDQIRFFAGAARMLEGKSAGEYMQGFTSFIRREPVGVIGQVTPWNYPMMMAVWKFAPAIAAGNTVVLKPSDTTPVTTIRMAELIAESGALPPGVFNVVCGNRETGRALVEHPTPSMVSITGSVRAGMNVAESAARNVKRSHLELGGKAPVVVFEDADISAAVEWLAVAGYFNAGQDCTAATRMLVSDKVYDEFVAAMALQARSTQTTFIGGPQGEGFVPPVNNSAQMDRVLGFLERAPKHAEIVAGGVRQGKQGFFIEPTVVANLEQTDEMIQQEIFGPVVTIQRFSDEADALHKANDVEYGLAASVWTSNVARALRMSKYIDAGAVWINTHIPIVAEMPHGGFKHSGYGKDLSMYGFEDYTRIKHVMASLEG
ncbi:MAG: gamma-aminobutyraldehyde dehydrogenase [Candidatus Nanopelagicales bacterium]|nr:gamma-aminobutyraldehyde dehydrogenase [Candidatus Nanopelagicales bacterium]